MNRRSVLSLVISGAAGSLACALGRRDEIRAKVGAMNEQQGLAILGLKWPSRHSLPTALTVTGASAGELSLPERPYYSVAVAPDAIWVAWVPKKFVTWPVGSEEQPVILFTDDPRSARSARFKGRCATQVAVSSKAEHIAFTAAMDAVYNRRLLVLNPATGEVEHDVTDLVSRFNLAEPHILQISANGRRLTAGWHDTFVVIDLPSHKIMFQADAQCPSFSPHGDELAFVEKHHDLVVANLHTGARRILLNRRFATKGVGGWSPDGRFLLAGGVPLLGYFNKLVVIDCVTDEYAEILPLGEGDWGQNCCWIKRRLMT